MQLNPARGRKHIGYTSCGSSSQRGLCSSTPRGDGNYAPNPQNCEIYAGLGLCSSTPRGDGNHVASVHSYISSPSYGLCSSTPRGDGNSPMTKSSGSWQSWGFMQLNPARGRKLHTACLRYDAQYLVVYAAQPREGTETRISPLHNPPNRWVVYAAQPREGTETQSVRDCFAFRRA